MLSFGVSNYFTAMLMDLHLQRQTNTNCTGYSVDNVRMQLGNDQDSAFAV